MMAITDPETADSSTRAKAWMAMPNENAGAAYPIRQEAANLGVNQARNAQDKENDAYFPVTP